MTDGIASSSNWHRVDLTMAHSVLIADEIKLFSLHREISLRISFVLREILASIRRAAEIPGNPSAENPVSAALQFAFGLAPPSSGPRSSLICPQLSLFITYLA
jgi:hypothetical protein